MKLYRDMTPAERAQADEDHRYWLECVKEGAEDQMAMFDRLSPEEREAERNSEFEVFY